MTKRNLIIIHRGPEYQRDFDDIATRVNSLDRDITVYHLPATLRTKLPDHAWQFPTLTVSLAPDFDLPVSRGPVLRNHPIDKLTQQSIFRKNGIPTPPAQRFQIGSPLDPILFGEFVILKPANLMLTSHGDGIMMLRRRRAEQLTHADFQSGRLLSSAQSSYLVQKFIYTGPDATSYRATTFLGNVLALEILISNNRSPPLDADDSLIEQGNFISKGDRRNFLTDDGDVLALAVETARCFPTVPLLGVDVVRDLSGRLFVLEVNAGGNTWHFSSRNSEEHRRRNPALFENLRTQFGAFDVAARRLCEEVQRQAS